MSNEPTRPDDDKRRLPVARPVTPPSDDEDSQPISRPRRPTHPLPVPPRFESRDTQTQAGIFSRGRLIQFAMGLIMLILIVLALFLPPISIGDRLAPADSDQDIVVEQMQTIIIGGLSFTPLNENNATITGTGLVIETTQYPPGTNYGVHLATRNSVDYLAGNLPENGWNCAIDIPSGHALASSIYSLTQTGTPPVEFDITVSPSPEGEDNDSLELYAWDARQNSWVFVPSRPVTERAALTTTLDFLPSCLALFRNAASTRHVSIAVGMQDQVAPELIAANMEFFPDSGRLLANGRLEINQPAAFTANPDYAVSPLFQNFDDPAIIDIAAVQTLLANPGLRTEHAQQIAAWVTTEASYTGAAIDYRSIPGNQGDAYTAFIAELAVLLHEQDRSLTVILPAPDESGAEWNTGAYDWAALGQFADQIVIRSPLDPLMYTEDGRVNRMLSWALTQLPRNKLRLGIDAHSVAGHGDQTFESITSTEAYAYLGSVQLTPAEFIPGQAITANLTHPANIQATFAARATGPAIVYETAEGNVLRTMLLTDSHTLYTRLTYASRYNLGGVFVWNLVADGTLPDLTNALLAYRLDQTVDAAPPLALNWRALIDGNVVAQANLQPGEPFAFVPNTGTLLQIEVTLNGQQIDDTELSFGMPAPTAVPVDTLSPSPTATLVPTTAAPTQTLIPATITLTQTPVPTAVVPTIAPTDILPPTIPPTAPPTDTLPPTALPTEPPTEPPTVLPTARPTESPIPPVVPTETLIPTATATRITLPPTLTPAQPIAAPESSPTPGSDIEPLPPLPGSDATALIQPSVTPAPVATEDVATEVVAPVATETTTGVAGAQPTATTPSGIVPLDLNAPLPTVDPAILAGATVDTTFAAGAFASGITADVLYAKRMGLTWLMLDARYYLGQSAAIYAPQIAEGQANGLKILLNVTGLPYEFEGTDRATYLGGYTKFVGDLAALGADGIEIWYGMNGRMSPDQYVQMLAHAYHAIKTANPNSLVITGALRPVESTSDLDEDDATYYIRLGEANVTQYADCIGLQYTLGTTPPIATSGDLRGDSPLYYLPSTIDRAQRAAQGIVPVCFTRIGYLSPEGYAALPAEYAWAQALTADQQGEWLAAALQLSQEGTQVRLFIIWSLNAAAFGGGSPESGYAIIRPDGSCAACDRITPLLNPEAAP